MLSGCRFPTGCAQLVLHTSCARNISIFAHICMLTEHACFQPNFRSFCILRSHVSTTVSRNPFVICVMCVSRSAVRFLLAGCLSS